MAFSDTPVTRSVRRAIALALANSMERHGHTCDSLAVWMSERGDELSATVVKRWRNTSDARTIQADRLAQLPPAMLRDMLVWFANLQNAIVVDRVLTHDEAETDEELALDAVCAANSLVMWLRSKEQRGDINEICNEGVRAFERVRMGNARPGLRKAAPANDVKKLGVA